MTGRCLLALARQGNSLLQGQIRRCRIGFVNVTDRTREIRQPESQPAVRMRSFWPPKSLTLQVAALGSVAAAMCWALLSGPPGRPFDPIAFEDIAERSGIHFVVDNSVSTSRHQIETMIAGVGVFDYNNDGKPDIYFVNGAAFPDLRKTGPAYYNRLYRNNGDGTFTDVTAAAGVAGAGYGMGVAAGDYDNDGFVDLFVPGVNRNILFHNRGDG